MCPPDNVEQSLLSASCDAKEIVHQLKEYPTLNKVVLERPDDDTKKIIRSLAQKARDLKRLDVFVHLREIAPDGTTGWLPISRNLSCHETIGYVRVLQKSNQNHKENINS